MFRRLTEGAYHSYSLLDDLTSVLDTYRICYKSSWVTHPGATFSVLTSTNSPFDYHQAVTFTADGYWMDTIVARAGSGGQEINLATTLGARFYRSRRNLGVIGTTVALSFTLTTAGAAPGALAAARVVEELLALVSAEMGVPPTSMTLDAGAPPTPGRQLAVHPAPLARVLQAPTAAVTVRVWVHTTELGALVTRLASSNVTAWCNDALAATLGTPCADVAFTLDPATVAASAFDGSRVSLPSVSSTPSATLSSGAAASTTPTPTWAMDPGRYMEPDNHGAAARAPASVVGGAVGGVLVAVLLLAVVGTLAARRRAGGVRGACVRRTPAAADAISGGGDGDKHERDATRALSFSFTLPEALRHAGPSHRASPGVVGVEEPAVASLHAQPGSVAR